MRSVMNGMKDPRIDRAIGVCKKVKKKTLASFFKKKTVSFTSQSEQDKIEAELDDPREVGLPFLSYSVIVDFHRAAQVFADPLVDRLASFPQPATLSRNRQLHYQPGVLPVAPRGSSVFSTLKTARQNKRTFIPSDVTVPQYAHIFSIVVQPCVQKPQSLSAHHGRPTADTDRQIATVLKVDVVLQAAENMKFCTDCGLVFITNFSPHNVHMIASLHFDCKCPADGQFLKNHLTVRCGVQRHTATPGFPLERAFPRTQFEEDVKEDGNHGQEAERGHHGDDHQVNEESAERELRVHVFVRHRYDKKPQLNLAHFRLPEVEERWSKVGEGVLGVSGSTPLYKQTHLDRV
ncbi:hypothetical protein F7725_002439 [Dissostichus mawsoni]|uniref:Uncharacterized protein n=1 Tax=Dissostichus mawsoni TaxID=36200 RepID=A0A7J5Y2K9_DISMA|nr:hypothetical protein F7725_002439 [Dissostichus mawsoni]